MPPPTVLGALAFGPDGRWIVAGSAEVGTIHRFALDVDDVLALARERISRSLTDEECRRYLHVAFCP